MYSGAKSTSTWLGLDRGRLLIFADYLAVALAVSLPLSTSATSVLVVVWLLVLLPTLDLAELRGEVTTWAGGLPVLLVVLASFGMLWADVTWAARAAGLRPFLKLAVIPLFFVQFRRSDRGLWIVYGLLASCTVLMLASFAMILPLGAGLRLPGKLPGIVVKDYISQSGFFVLSIFLLLELSAQALREQGRALVVAYAVLIAAFLADIAYVATSRTSLFVIPVLLVLFGIRRSWKIALGACVVWAILLLTAWASSPYLGHRLGSAFSLSTNSEQLEAVSNRQRLGYWAASTEFIEEAPIIGHGTGSITAMFERYAAAHPGTGVNQVANPHNQTFAITLQLGLLGAIVLYGMWVAHGGMFRGPGMAAWFGMVVVAQNFFSSLVNSHLSDFTQGWTYAVCVGVAGGMVLRQTPPDPAQFA